MRMHTWSSWSSVVSHLSQSHCARRLRHCAWETWTATNSRWISMLRWDSVVYPVPTFYCMFSLLLNVRLLHVRQFKKIRLAGFTCFLPPSPSLDGRCRETGESRSMGGNWIWLNQGKNWEKKKLWDFWKFCFSLLLYFGKLRVVWICKPCLPIKGKATCISALVNRWNNQCKLNVKYAMPCHLIFYLRMHLKLYNDLFLCIKYVGFRFGQTCYLMSSFWN